MPVSLKYAAWARCALRCMEMQKALWSHCMSRADESVSAEQSLQDHFAHGFGAGEVLLQHACAMHAGVSDVMADSVTLHPCCCHSVFAALDWVVSEVCEWF